MRAGADDYVVKPFSARELLVRISSRLRNLLRHAPAALALPSRPEHVLEIANREYARATGRPEASLIGKSVRGALPELSSQGFVYLLDGVFRTGKPFVGSEITDQVAARRLLGQYIKALKRVEGEPKERQPGS